MSLLLILLFCASLLFALNMGGSALAPSFAVCIGAKMLSRWQAQLLFAIFVALGALAFGRFVAKTLGSSLVPPGTLDTPRTFCVIVSATTGLFLANILKIPQSASWVTVFAISTVGIRESKLRTQTLVFKLLPAWLALPLSGFTLTLVTLRLFYPLRAWNTGFYTGLHKHRWKLKALAVLTSCYVATAIGANNVANVAAPLAAAGLIDLKKAFLLAAPIFGLGATVFPSPARTVGQAIVPVGEFTACLCNLVTGSLLLLASRLGIPQSLVQLNVSTILAVSLVKEGSYHLMPKGLLRRMGLLWLGTPLLAAGMTWILLEVFT